METVSRWKSFGGELGVYRHASEVCQCPMEFAVYSPPLAQSQEVPVLWYLSGLTCNWSNVMEKSGLQRVASELGLMVIAPDTSPRGEQVANDDAYDLGQGAGFYLTATEAPWSPHFQMDTYIVEELQRLVVDNFSANPNKQGITGHSMGGHGALTLHFKNPNLYQSVSAFSPISSPMQVPWGKKAFQAYLGNDESVWENYDATQLVSKQTSDALILIDTGDADQFLEEQLQPEQFIQACESAGQALNYQMQSGYDHSYWFIAGFIEKHLRHHAAQLS